MIRQFRKWICFGVVCLAALMAVPVAAQLPAGTILGVVNDTSGARSLGGPIKKNKTFFFGVYEGLRQNVGVTNDLNVPSTGCHGPAGASIWNGAGTQPSGTLGPCPDLGPAPTDPNPTSPTVPYVVPIDPGIAPFLTLINNPNLGPAGPGQPPRYTFPSTSVAHENYRQIRVDHNFSASDMFFARYTIDDDFLNEAPNGNFSYFRNGTTQRNQYITLSESHIFSPRVLNTARFSFNRTNFANHGLPQGLPNNGQGPPVIAGDPTGTIGLDSAGYTGLGPVNPLTFGTQNIYTLSDDVNVSWGKHTFKFGTLLNRWNEGTQGANSKNGVLNFGTLAGFLQSTPTLVEFGPLNANENRDYIYDALGFYAQDSWRMTSRLTWDLGLRYEFMTTPYDMTGHSSRLLPT